MWRFTDLVRRVKGIADAERIDHADQNTIGPQRHRYIDLTGGPVNTVVPTGEVWIIVGITPETITAGQLFLLTVDSKLMYWCSAHAAMDFCGGDPAFSYHRAAEKFYNVQKMIRPIIAVEGQIVSVQSQDDTGAVMIEYRDIGAGKGIDKQSDGGYDGKTRTIQTISRQVTSVAAGATVDIGMVTNFNPAGVTTFPFGTVSPPNREYELLIFFVPVDTTVGTNLVFDGIRVLHEGRELLTPAGLVQAPGNIAEGAMGTVTRFWTFPHGHLIRPFETVQVFMRVTSTDAAAQDATLECGFLVNERFIVGER